MSDDLLSGASLRRIDQGEPPVEQIHETLLAAILSLELAPGVRVSEAGIARAVGASRTPVRAALARLGEKGLIETRPSRGNYVTLLSASAVRDAHFIRDALERATVQWLATEGLPETMSRRIDDNLAEAAKAIHRADKRAFGELDDEFHHLLAEATGNARLLQVYEREKSALARLRALCPTDDRYVLELLDEHQAIVDAIRARDDASARAHVSTHIGRVLTLLADLQRDHGDFFGDDTIA